MKEENEDIFALIKEECELDDEWIKEYEKTDEYEQIYGEDKEISDAQIVC